jgi:hypothetical protein
VRTRVPAERLVWRGACIEHVHGLGRNAAHRRRPGQAAATLFALGQQGALGPRRMLIRVACGVRCFAQRDDRRPPPQAAAAAAAAGAAAFAWSCVEKKRDDGVGAAPGVVMAMVAVLVAVATPAQPAGAFLVGEFGRVAAGRHRRLWLPVSWMNTQTLQHTWPHIDCVKACEGTGCVGWVRGTALRRLGTASSNHLHQEGRPPSRPAWCGSDLQVVTRQHSMRSSTRMSISFPPSHT